MNPRAANSGGSADRTPPSPPIEFFLVLPDGSCIPATPDACRIVMKQARSATRAQARLKRLEKAAELQCAIEDRAAAHRVAQELAEAHRASLRWAARFRARVRPEQPASRTSPVQKQPIGPEFGISSKPVATVRPPSSWAVDDLGFRGVIWQQSYIGRSSPGFGRGAARAHWDYIVRDEAVLLDADGEPVIITNMGADWIEVGAAWQAIEDATTRVNGKVQMRAIAPFDSDMSEAEMIDALEHFCRTVLDPLELPYSATIHRPPAGGDARNFHPHIAFGLRPARRIEPYCWDIADQVCGEFDGRDGIQMLRHLWAHAMSEAAERARSNRRYTGLGYGARGLDLEAGEHLGEARSAIVARGGHVWAHERNRIKNRRNALRRAIRDADRKVEAIIKIQDAALARSSQAAIARPGNMVRATPSVESTQQIRPSDAVRRDRRPRLGRQLTPDRQPVVRPTHEQVTRQRRDRQMVLADVPALGDRPRLDLMAAFPALPTAAIPAAAAAQDAERLRLLGRIDAYVADYGGGSPLDVTTAALKVIGVDEAWLERPWVQQGLAALRTRQQALVDWMIEDADRRPLDYAKAGTRFWPRNIDADRLGRLDRWAADPGFQRDVFAIERRIYEAHRARDAALRQETTSAGRPGDIGFGGTETGTRIADGFGGWRYTPPPMFVQRAVSPRIAPFDPRTGTPHRSLLNLLHHCGTRPRTLAFASDGKLMTVDGVPKTVELAVQLWRDDPQVEALVVETVTASRAAGQPVWPGTYETAIRTLAGNTSRRREQQRRRRPPPSQGRER